MSESILVADDSVLVRESIETALRARGARVEVVNDGTQAVERLRESAPDLVIADVHMPGVDGFGVCREAKAQRPATRVLLLVGTFEPFDSGAASSARADGVVRKPFLPDELLRKVEELLGPVRSRTPERQSPVEDPPAAEPSTAEVAPLIPEPVPVPDSGVGGDSVQLSDADIDRIARRVLELGGAEVLERVARELLGEAAVERVRRSGDLTPSETSAGGHDDWRGDPEREWTGLSELARALRGSPGIQVENLIVAERVDSTNTLARRLFDNAWSGLGPGPEALIVALEQTAGRGRQGRAWVSRRGLGIYATLLLAIGEVELQTLPLLVGVGLARALERLGCPARLKWPNDLQVGGRKLGGILIESISRDATRVAAAIVGFGVNHGHGADELPTPASTSLRQLLDPLPPFARVASALIESVLAELARAGDVAYAWRAYQELTVHRSGDVVRCRIAHEDLEGVFLGFDERGFLRLAVDGRERRVASGEIVE